MEQQVTIPPGDPKGSTDFLSLNRSVLKDLRKTIQGDPTINLGPVLRWHSFKYKTELVFEEVSEAKGRP